MYGAGKREKWLCLLIACLTSLAFCLENDNYVISEELRVQLGGAPAVLLWQLNQAFIPPGYVAVITVILLYFAYRHLIPRLDKKLFKWSIPFSVIGSFLMLLGESFYQYSNWDKVFGGKTAFLLSVGKGAGVAIGLFFVFHIICLQRIELERYAEQKYKAWRETFFVVLLLMLCWIPYIIAMFPGNFCPDAADEIAQITGSSQYCWTIKSIVPEYEGALWNNHHPVFYTWLLAVFVKLGEVLNSSTIAFALYTVLQCVCMASVFAYFLNYIKKMGVQRKVRLGILLFFALNPIFPLWGVAISKDTYFSMVVLLSILYLYRLIKMPEQCTIKNCVVTSAWLLLMMLLRNNGFYMLLAILPFIAYFFRKERKQFIRVVAVLVIPMLVFQIGVQGILFPALHISKGSIREMLSVPFQQTARYVKEFELELDAEDIKNIQAILGKAEEKISVIGERYVPEHADAVKNRYNPQATGEDIKRYFKTWAKGLVKHPDVYIEAFLNLGYPWFTFDSHYDFRYYNEFVQEDAKGNMQRTEQRVREMLGDMERLDCFERTSQAITYMVDTLAKIPFLSWTVEFSFYTWAYIIGLLILVIRKKHQELLACGILFMNYLICFVGPVAYTRYAMPMIVCAPFVVILVFSEKGSRKNR